MQYRTEKDIFSQVLFFSLTIVYSAIPFMYIYIIYIYLYVPAPVLKVVRFFISSDYQLPFGQVSSVRCLVYSLVSTFAL